MSNEVSIKKKFFFTILIFFTIGTLTLPTFLKNILNSQLKNIGNEYTGKVKDLWISPMRGNIGIENLQLTKKNDKSPKLLEIGKLNIEILWSKLLKKEIFLNIIAKNLDLTLDQSNGHNNEDNDREHWTEVLDTYIPISINNIYIKESKIKLTSLNIENMNEIEIYINDLDTKEVLLSKHENNNLSKLKARGKIFKNADFKLNGGIDLKSSPLRLNLDLEIDKFNLAEINSTLMSYLPVNITEGKMYFHSHYSGTTERAKGNFKILIKDLDIIESNQEYISIDHIAFEWLIGFVNWILQVSSGPEISIKAPFKIDQELSLDTTEVFWSAISDTKSSPHLDE